MCDPVTFMVLSTVVSTAGSVVQGMQQSATAQRNQQMASYQADVAEEQGKFNIRKAELDYTRHQGSVDAQVAASGFSIDGFEYVLKDDAQQAALEQAAVKFGSDQTVYQTRYQADSYGKQANDAMTAGIIGGVSNVIGGGANIVKFRGSQPRGSSGTGVSLDAPFDARSVGGTRFGGQN